MFLMRFTERAYYHYTEEDVRNSYRSAVRLTFPNSHFDTGKASHMYNYYLDEYEYCEEVGFDGLMLNEHHNTPTCMGAAMNLEAAILARTTKKPKSCCSAILCRYRKTPSEWRRSLRRLT